MEWGGQSEILQCGRVDLMVRTFGPIYLVDSIVEECRQHGAGDDV